VATTRNIEKMGGTARDMTEAQRDAYEALVDNLAAARRRNSRLAQNGLEFLKLQEDNARATREWFAGGVRLLELQRRNVGFVQDWAGEGIEALRDQTAHNLRTAEAIARNVRKQQEGLRTLTEDWAGAYRRFFSPFAYAQEGLRTAQEATRQGVRATQQVAEEGLRLAEEATEQTGEVLRQTEKATREAELRTTVFAALGTQNYDELTVDEVSKRLDGLSAEQLKAVRQYEKQNKNRETLVEQIDRRIKAAS
jgi:hypothetical protein